MLDDSNPKRYEKERIKNVRIRCWNLYRKATGLRIKKKDFLAHCEGSFIFFL